MNSFWDPHTSVVFISYFSFSFSMYYPLKYKHITFFQPHRSLPFPDFPECFLYAPFPMQFLRIWKSSNPTWNLFLFTLFSNDFFLLLRNSSSLSDSTEFSGCDLCQKWHHSSVQVIPKQKGIWQGRPLNWGCLGLHISQNMPNSTYADDQGYGGNAVLREGEQNEEGIRPHSQWEYSIKRLTGQTDMPLWSEQPSKGCRERGGSNIEMSSTVTTPQEQLDPYRKFNHHTNVVICRETKGTLIS